MELKLLSIVQIPARVKAVFCRKDVIAQLQAYGISSEEALARVDNLIDQEVALIAGKLDQLPADSLAKGGLI